LDDSEFVSSETRTVLNRLKAQTAGDGVWLAITRQSPDSGQTPPFSLR
jgi:hypothetical protein